MLALHTLASAGDQVLASSGSSDDGGGLGFAFLASGIVFYIVMYLRYRNSDKRHNHESETEATLLNMQQTDELVKRRTGLSNSRMDGANNNEVRGARQRFF